MGTSGMRNLLSTRKRPETNPSRMLPGQPALGKCGHHGFEPPWPVPVVPVRPEPADPAEPEPAEPPLPPAVRLERPDGAGPVVWKKRSSVALPVSVSITALGGR